MERKNVESLLYCYKYLEMRAEEIHNKIYRNATTFGYKYYDTFDAVDEILDMSAQKNSIINLKILVDRCIGYCNEKSKCILLMISQLNYGAEQIMQEWNISERSAYRYMRIAIEEFGGYVTKYSSTLLDVIDNERWIKSLSHSYRVSRATNSIM